MSARLLAMFGSVLLLVGLSPLAAPAGTFDITKITTWDVSKVTKNGGVEKIEENGGPGTGTYRSALHAFAADKHGSGHADSPAKAADQGDLTGVPLASGLDGTKPFGTGKNANPQRTDHLHWTKDQAFDQIKNLAKVSDKVGPVSSVHPEASASVEISTTRLGAVLPGGRFATESAIRLQGSALIKTPIPANHAPESAYAEAFAAGEVKLTGIANYAVITEAGKAPRFVNKATGKLTGGTDANQTDKTKPASNAGIFRDPLALSVFDDDTGSLLASQNLFHENWTAEDDASVEWTDLGLSLVTGTGGGLASVDLGTESSWILSPFSGTASLENGVLTTSGFFSTLTWTTSTVDGITTAFLDASEFAPEIDFQVLPTGSWASDAMLRLVWSSSTDGLASAYQFVPEPSSLLLCTLAAASVFAARRRLLPRP